MLFRTTGGEHMLYDMTTARPTLVRVVQKALSRAQRRKDALFRAWPRERHPVADCWRCLEGAAIHRQMAFKFAGTPAVLGSDKRHHLDMARAMLRRGAQYNPRLF